MITVYCVLGKNEMPTVYTIMHETFEVAERELDNLFTNRSSKFVERMRSMELTVCEIHSNSAMLVAWQKARWSLVASIEDYKLASAKSTSERSAILA